jgi:hypothetical protein
MEHVIQAVDDCRVFSSDSLLVYKKVNGRICHQVVWVSGAKEEFVICQLSVSDDSDDLLRSLADLPSLFSLLLPQQSGHKQEEEK